MEIKDQKDFDITNTIDAEALAKRWGVTKKTIDNRRLKGERPKEYFDRRDAVCADLAIKTGKWSKLWCHRLLTWGDHLQRPRNASSWAYKLFHTQDASWLRLQRLPFICSTRSLDAGATNTRLLAERPKPRWEEALDKALAFVQT